METLSKIISIILVFLIVGLASYKCYGAIKADTNSKEMMVLNKKVVEKANDCYLDKKCTNKTVTLDYLIQNGYLNNIVNPITKEVISTNSYVNLETNKFVILN